MTDAYNDPPPVQQPRPPIMIGGRSEKATLRIVAQYADFCNVGGVPKAARGRGNAESRAAPGAASPPTSAFRAPRSAFGKVGAQYLTFHLPDAREITPIRLLGETVVPAVATF